MSLSTLSSQLAHINNASTNKGVTGGTYGSSIPTTRKTDDVIGRGIHHSAKHGHAVISSNVKKIPSVLFENPKVCQVMKYKNILYVNLFIWMIEMQQFTIRLSSHNDIRFNLSYEYKIYVHKYV